MAINALGSADIPLSTFGSLDTELSPSDVPAGISPDCRDVVFEPGTVKTRPALERVFTTALDAGQVVYQKGFITAAKVFKNLYLTSLGNMWVEDVTNSPGTATLLFTTKATRAESCTEDGVEYIALADGVHGYDVPVQYDGTNVYKVTQDGPGSPPTVTNLAIPPDTMQAPSPVVTAITSITVSDLHLIPFGGFYYASFTVTLAASAALFLGQTVTIAGNTEAAFNGVWTVSEIIDAIHFKVANYSTLALTGTGGTVSTTSGTMTRASNVVTVYLQTFDQSLQVGYLVQIAGISASPVGGGIVSIVVDNEAAPGVATVTTTTAHGLVPQSSVSITGVPSTAVGGAITAAVRNGNIASITTTTEHGLSVGAVVTLGGVSDATFNGNYVVQTIIDAFTFTFADVDIDATSSGGAVSVNWPIPDTPEPTYFSVVSVPSPTTFQVQFNYADASWMGGVASFPWDGKFYITNVIQAENAIQYQQYGPDSSTTDVGTVTAFGQIVPGLHQLQVLFVTQEDAITEPSPPVTFMANGGQYLAISNIAIGPPSIKARILQFTGSGGAYFFYLPIPAQVNGQIVSTATQINDNTTTSTVLDFSDATLYRGIATSVPGNNLVEQVVLGPVGGFFAYSSRLMAWGEYNKIQNLLNMGFDGGYLPSASTQPNGWTQVSTGGVLGAGRFQGFRYEFTGAGEQSQSFYQDAYGDPIAEAKQTYTIRGYFTGAGMFVATIAGAGFTTTATITFTQDGWYSTSFLLPMPATIPNDMTLSIKRTAGTFTVDDLIMIFARQPFSDTTAKFSYEDNFEGFDGLTGLAGPEDDQTAIRNWGIIRDTLMCVTGGSLHETIDNETTEPSGWGFRHVSDNCGAWSIASIARNVQGIGSAGKEWMTWNGPDGIHVFSGQQPYKISQEIQSLAGAVDQALAYQVWSINDQINKRCYFGYPNSGMQLLVLDYRNLDGEGIASSAPIRASFTGQMVVSDMARKWTPWTLPSFCGGLIYRPNEVVAEVSFGGGPAGANSYLLNPFKYTDDDFGQIFSYYTSFFFITQDMEQSYKLGSHRHLYQYLAFTITGVGYFNATPLGDVLTNAFPITPNLALSLMQNFDIEIGLNVETNRCAFKIAAFPLTGQTDAAFSLSKLIVNMRNSPWIKVRGTNTGSF